MALLEIVKEALAGWELHTRNMLRRLSELGRTSLSLAMLRPVKAHSPHFHLTFIFITDTHTRQLAHGILL